MSLEFEEDGRPMRGATSNKLCDKELRQEMTLLQPRVGKDGK